MVSVFHLVCYICIVTYFYSNVKNYLLLYKYFISNKYRKYYTPSVSLNMYNISHYTDGVYFSNRAKVFLCFAYQFNKFCVLFGGDATCCEVHIEHICGQFAFACKCFTKSVSHLNFLRFKIIVYS